MKPMTVDRMRRAFKLYMKVDNRMNCLKALRKDGVNGILNGKDDDAIAYQNIYFRKHVLQCILNDQPINWFFASWLDNTERRKRNLEADKAWENRDACAVVELPRICRLEGYHIDEAYLEEVAAGDTVDIDDCAYDAREIHNALDKAGIEYRISGNVIVEY